VSYTEILNTGEAICPYCKWSHTPGTMPPDTKQEKHCDECGHNYYLTRDIAIARSAVTYHTEPDCEINGYDHDEMTKTSKGTDYSYCLVCDKEL